MGKLTTTPITKVFIAPLFDSPDNGRGGIRFVVQAMKRHLPKFGVEVVDHPDKADVLNLHVGTDVKGYDHLPLVHSCHGLYWSDFHWSNIEALANQHIINIMKKADVITVPSQWVKTAIGRGILADIRVIYHGVDSDDWLPPDQSSDYIIWNKNRLDPVCDPMALVNLAKNLPQTQFISTLVPRESGYVPNIQEIGVLPQEQHKPFLQGAAVYLATTLETFGTSTLEALASGVPVAGWGFGGTAEIVKQGQTGYLAPPGDIDSLTRCIQRCYAERDRLSKNAIADIKENWEWPKMIEQYADIFKSLHIESITNQPEVSIVVPSHSYGHFLPDTLQSVKNQVNHENWECIIVGDAPIDNTAQVANEFAEKDNRFRYIQTDERLDMSLARNFGAEHAKGKYISFLDADDQLTPNAISILASAMNNDRSIGIAYGHLDINNGEQVWRNPKWPASDFVWEYQVAHMNQIPYFNMMRRKKFLLSGGFRSRYEWGEDAHLWAYLTSYGFNAKKVTDDSVLIYRAHPNSKSTILRREGKSEAYTKWIPWATARSLDEAKKMRNFDIKLKEIVPFAAPIEKNPWPTTSHHHNPKISVIIPCGPGHRKWLVDAIDSVMAQTFLDWEIIVINDTGNDWDSVPNYPFVRVKVTNQVGAGEARNVGVRAARGECLLFLDADDYLVPGGTLDTMWKTYKQTDNIIYGDLLAEFGGELQEYPGLPEQYCGSDLDRTTLKRPTRPVTSLVPKRIHNDIGGFDPTFETYEDWDYNIATDVKGYCATKLTIPIFVYRVDAGKRRRWASPAEAENEQERQLAEIARADTKQKLYLKWEDYYKGVKPMGCGGGCGGSTKINTRVIGNNKARVVRGRNQETHQEEIVNQDSPILLEYLGSNKATQTILGPITRRAYRFGNNTGHKVRHVDPTDAVILLSRTKRGQKMFKVYESPSRPQKQAEVSSPPLTELIMPKSMPEGITNEGIKEMPDTARQIRANIALQSKATLAEWLNFEKSGKNRKTVISALLNQLNKFEESE